MSCDSDGKWKKFIEALCAYLRAERLKDRCDLSENHWALREVSNLAVFRMEECPDQLEFYNKVGFTSPWEDLFEQHAKDWSEAAGVEWGPE